jgi:hypothetical protein
MPKRIWLSDSLDAFSLHQGFPDEEMARCPTKNDDLTKQGKSEIPSGLKSQDENASRLTAAKERGRCQWC